MMGNSKSSTTTWSLGIFGEGTSGWNGGDIQLMILWRSKILK